MKKNIILIIDDQQELCIHMKSLLQLENYEVHVAHSGQEAFALLSSERFDLVLCALAFADMNGYEIMNKIRKTYGPFISFIFMTKEYDKYSFRKAMSEGADDCLIKPFTGEELLSMVEVRINKQLLYMKDREKEDETANRLEDFFQYVAEKPSIFSNCKIRNLKNKEVLFSEGDLSLHIYYVVSGSVKTFKEDAEGNHFLTDICKKGDLIGYTSVLTGQTLQETAVASEECKVMTIPKQEFIQFLYADRNAFSKIATGLCSKVHDANQKLINMAYCSARKRISEALLFIYGKYESLLVADNTISFQRDTIASLAAVSNECVSRTLSEFKKRGMIQISKNKIRILDFSGLRNIRN